MSSNKLLPAQHYSCVSSYGKKNTLSGTDENIKLDLDPILGHYDMVDIAAQLPSINHTPTNNKEVEVDASFVRDFIHVYIGQRFPKYITNGAVPQTRC